MHIQGKIRREDLLWLLGSLCGLYRIPFDAALIAQNYPPPTTLATFHETARALGIKTGTRSLTGIDWNTLPLPAIAFLRPEAPPGDEAADSAPLPVLILKSDGEKLLGFRAGSPAPETLPIEEANQRFLPDLILLAKQAELFAQKYSVIAQYNDTAGEGGLGTGFSATVFKDKDTGQLTLALRGTEGLDGKDLSTDASIFGGGAGYDQIVALYNWWSRVTTRPGDPIPQYRLVGVSSNPQAVQVGSQWLEPADTVVAVGGDIYNAVDLDSALEITGHSLGGHLAMAFSTLFAGFTTQVTVFNTPGFKNNFTNQDFFAALGGSVPTGTKITNVIADEATVGDNPWSAIAGLNSRPGTAVDIAIENQFGSDESNPPVAKNHSQQMLTDALAVYALLSTLDPALSTTSFKSLLHAASEGTAASLERLVDTLERQIDMDNTLMPSGNTNRDSLYQALDALQNGAGKAQYDALTGKVSIVPLNASNVVAKASQTDAEGLAYRYALVSLDPFVVLGADYTSHNASGALDLYDPSTGTGEITAQYLTDRSNFVARKTWFNSQDIAPVNLAYQYGSSANQYQNDETLFVDEASGYAIAQGFDPAAPYPNIHRYYFGDEQGNSYTGGEVADHLYGAGGNDTLTGDKGDDWLEGNGGEERLAGRGGRQNAVATFRNDTAINDEGRMAA